MNKEQFDKISARLKEVDGVVSKLHDDVRELAVNALGPYVGVGQGSKSGNGAGVPDAPADVASSTGDFDAAALVDKHPSDSPTQNSLLCLAIMYATYGKGSYGGWGVMKGIADEHALTVSANLPTTFKGQKSNGTQIFRRAQAGWSVTPAGESFLKEEYGVTKGSTPIP